MRDMRDDPIDLLRAAGYIRSEIDASYFYRPIAPRNSDAGAGFGIWPQL